MARAARAACVHTLAAGATGSLTSGVERVHQRVLRIRVRRCAATASPERADDAGARQRTGGAPTNTGGTATAGPAFRRRRVHAALRRAARTSTGASSAAGATAAPDGDDVGARRVHATIPRHGCRARGPGCRGPVARRRRSHASGRCAPTHRLIVAAGPAGIAAATATVGCIAAARADGANRAAFDPAAATFRRGAATAAWRSGARGIHAAVSGILESERAAVERAAVPGTARAGILRVAQRAEHVVAGRATAADAGRDGRRAVDHGPARPADVR